MGLDIVLNRDEKKALWSFISIYTISSVFLMSVIVFLYYNKELKSHKKVCQKDLQETIMEVELQLLKAFVEKKEFIFSPLDYTLQVGLFDKNREKIESNLNFCDVNFKETMNVKDERVHRVFKLKNPIQNISYIVAEDSSMPSNIKNLKYLIFLTIFISSIFIAFIGYLLSRILLKPVNEKIAQINHFIKDSAHEINTPVTALLMSVSALKKKGFGEQKLLKHIAISSKQISDIYNALSYVAFNDIKKSDEIVKFDLRKEVLKSIAFYKEIADAKNIKIVENLDPCYMKMDKDSANKLINNLLSNAIKYSYNNKTVYITLKDKTLTIKDEGMGIDEKDKQEILKRYIRGTDQVGGFGIGLDIVNSICNEYDIKLSIDSKPGVGSSFDLDFSNLSREQLSIQESH